MKNKKRGGVTLCVGTSGEKMGEETPEFVCRGCGYARKNCVCSVQKKVFTEPQKQTRFLINFA